MDNFGILAYIQALIADNFGILTHIQALIADDFGIFNTLGITSRHSTNYATNSIRILYIHK